MGCLSFDDLSWMARGRPCTAEDAVLASGTQGERNAWVKARAAEAGSLVRTEDRRGTDGEVYTAFWLAWPSWYARLAWSRPEPSRMPSTAPAAPGVWLVTVSEAAPLPGRVRAVTAAEDLAAAARDLPDGCARWIRADDAGALAERLRRLFAGSVAGSAHSRG